MPQHHKLTECLLHLGVFTHQPGESDSTAVPQTLPTEEYSDLCTGCSESHNPTYSDISFLSHPQVSLKNQIR